MNAKHLTKNAMSHKLVFLAAAIAIAIIAAFSICATSQAKANDIGLNNSINNVGIPSSITVTYDGPDLGKQEGNIYDSVTGQHKDIQWEKDDSVLKRMNDLSLGEITQIKVHQGKIEGNEETQFYYLSFNTTYWTGGGFSYSVIQYGFFHDSTPWKLGNDEVTFDQGNALDITNLSACNFNITPSDYSDGLNVSGLVLDDETDMPVPFANVVYCQWNPWFWDYIPVPKMSTFTDWFGNYTIEGVTEDMLPGVIRVYRWGYEVGESAPIWFVPEGIDTIYRFVEMTPAEPPVPPTPPDPPVPPGPVPPQPDPPQPVPPTPVPPTPVDPGTNVPQTSDAAGYVFAVFAMMALLSAGVLAGRKLYVK